MLLGFRGIKIKTFTIFITAFLIFANSSSSSENKIIKVGVFNFRPLVYVGRNKEIKGFFIDIFKHIAEKKGWKYEFISGSWSQSLERLKKGEIDILPSIAYTPERGKLFDFSHDFMFLDWGIIYKRKGTKIRTILDLANKKVSVLKKSIFTYDFKKLVESFNINASIIEKNEYRDIFKSINTGEADAGISTNVHATLIEHDYKNIERTHIVFTAIKLKFAVKKGKNKELLFTVDKIFEKLKKNRTSMYHQLYEKWLGLPGKKAGFPKWLLFLLAGLGITVIVTFFFVYLLKKQVNKQTVKITAQNNALKSLNDTLSENENRFRNLFEYSGVGVALIDSATRQFTKVNNKFCQITGYTKDDLYDMDFVQITHPDDISKDLEKRAQLFKSEIASFTMEKRYIHKEGHIIWVALTVTPAIKSLKGFDYHIAVVADITKRKIAEEEIRQLATFPTQNPFPVMRISKSGAALFANQAAEVILDYIKDDTGTANSFNFEKKISETLSENKIFMHEFPYDKNNKKTILLAFSPNIEYEYVNIYGIDITDLKKSQRDKERLISKLENALHREKASLEELEASYEEMASVQEELESTNFQLEKALDSAKEANMLKTEFLANMSHEIRTPLTAILGFNSLMSSDDNLTDEQKENLALVKISGERLLNLLMDILSISQIETGKVQIIKTDVDIEKLIKEIQDIFSLRFKEKDILFISNLSGITSIYTDEKRLNQILINLIGNAIKFTNKGKITLDLLKEDGYYVFSVTDEGIGIDEKVREKIFDSFVIGEVGYRKTYQGAGLGLTICKRLTNLLGGEIHVESELSKGSRFYFSIPCDELQIKGEDNLGNDEKKEAAHIRGSKKLHIGMVDDEEMILKYVELLIKQKTKHKISCFESCTDFLKTDLTGYDMLLVDIRMPDMDGIECLRKFKKENKTAPVIALTAFSLESDKNKFLSEGFDGYFTKPIDVDNFISMIETYSN